MRATPCICFVAEHDDIAYASAIWSAPVARQLNGRNWLELRRLAIADDAPKNTATRMLRIMRMIIAKELPEVVHLISYQDTAVHSGTIYKAAGWTAAYTSKLPRWDKGAGRTKQRTSPVADGVKVRWELSLLNVQGMARREGRPPCQDGLSPSPSPSCSGSSKSPTNAEK